MRTHLCLHGGYVYISMPAAHTVPITFSGQWALYPGCSLPGMAWAQTNVCVCVFIFVCVWDSNLVVRRGKPEEVVADLIKQLGSVSTVAFHEEVISLSLSLVSWLFGHSDLLLFMYSRLLQKSWVWRAEWRKSVHRWKSKFTPAGAPRCTTEMIFHFTIYPGARQ